MKILILSRNSKLYSTQSLIAAGEKRGHEVEVVDPLLCYMDITSKKPAVFFRKKRIEGVDAVIPRIGASVTWFVISAFSRLV